MRDKRIIRLKLAAERDASISAGAFHLLCRLCSHLYVDPKTKVDEAFPLPWSKVANWCFLSDRDTCTSRISELVKSGYLKCDGLRGCPPINYFFLQLNCRENPAIKSRENPAIESSKNPAIKCGKNPAHHISNSFQEEKIKEKSREIKSSLRSTGTVGDSKAAAPERVKLTPAQLQEGLHGLSQLRRDLERKTKAGTAFEKKT